MDGVWGRLTTRLIPACAGKTVLIVPVPSPVAAHPRVCGENGVLRRHRVMHEGSSPRVRGKLTPQVRRYIYNGLIPACAGKTTAERAQVGAGGAHPRVCGENVLVADRAARRWGSSPRVRGKPHNLEQVADHPGLIPACAGKTATLWRPWPPSTAHPRVCGENFVPWVFVSMLWGSSPRVRGKQYDYVHSLGTPGLIPACAGKTPRTPRSCTRAWAHPRVCGENVWAPQAGDPDEGSSPRVRGKPHRLGPHARPRGLIPACAGKTAGTIVVTHPTGAHPRVCGENRGERFADCRRDGSSPRVRGKRHRGLRRRLPCGLIPACAGKTSRPPRPPPSRPAHPRVCGENIQGFIDGIKNMGSSPRVRGKHRAARTRGPPRRLIPACAGKTTAGRRATASPGAHPRVCGENRGRRPTEEAMRGSSPRVRGKLDDVPQRLTDLRLIPACAGKTSRSS